MAEQDSGKVEVIGVGIGIEFGIRLWQESDSDPDSKAASDGSAASGGSLQTPRVTSPGTTLQ